MTHIPAIDQQEWPPRAHDSRLGHLRQSPPSMRFLLSQRSYSPFELGIETMQRNVLLLILLKERYLS